MAGLVPCSDSKGEVDTSSSPVQRKRKREPKLRRVLRVQDDDLSLARALVVARARWEREQDEKLRVRWDSIRHGETKRSIIQKNMAMELMKASGLGEKEGSCGNEELKKIQEFLEPQGYQIFVFTPSRAEGDKPIFEGKVDSMKHFKPLHLVKSGNHFNVLSSVSKLFKASKKLESSLSMND